MSKILIDLEEESTEAVPLSDYKPERKGGRGRKVFGIFAGILLLLVAAAGIGGFLYWQHLKTTPQYSLALLVSAAQRQDQKAIDKLVDTDAVIDDFVPQIVDKAVELYGKGLAPELIRRVATIAAPIMPVVKERARAELPALLRERTGKFKNVPFIVMAASAGRYLEVKIDGDIAKVSSKLKERPLEIKMKRVGDRWRVVGIQDEALAQRIASKVGQQIVALAKNRSDTTIENLGKKIGVKNLGDLIDKAGKIFKK